MMPMSTHKEPKLSVPQRKLLKEVIQEHPLVRSDHVKDRETLLSECGVFVLRESLDCKAEPFFFASRLVTDLENCPDEKGYPLLLTFLTNFLEQYGQKISVDKRQPLYAIAQPRLGGERLENMDDRQNDRKTVEVIDGNAPTPQMQNDENKKTNFIRAFINDAVQAVPAVKWAVGIGGIAGVVALVGMPVFGLHEKVAFIGIVAALGLMGVLVIFARMARFSKELVGPAKAFTWFVLLLFIVVSILLVSSGFFGYPREFSTLFN